MLSVEQNKSLKAYNTFGMDVNAAFFSSIDSLEALKAVKYQEVFQHGLLLLGGGSNILFTNHVPHWVLHICLKGIELMGSTQEFIWIRVAAGEIWHDFVQYCVRNQYAGLENLSLIPGYVGAAPIQNIGAYGIEVKDYIESVEVWDVENEKMITLDNKSCQFGYRNSIFKQTMKGGLIITSVVFKLYKQPNININYGQIKDELMSMGVESDSVGIADVARAVMNIRRFKLPDPSKIGNAGSFFKNPELFKEQYALLKQNYPDMPGYETDKQLIKIPAAFLIEKCGWKGYRNDNYGVHDKQALVLVNHANASGTDIFNLSEEIISSVSQKFGIYLEREVQII